MLILNNFCIIGKQTYFNFIPLTNHRRQLYQFNMKLNLNKYHTCLTRSAV